MRERFLAGDDVSGGVRPEVLLSWYRCRDDYKVDPFQERAPSARERETCQLLEEKVVVTELAGAAKSIGSDVEAIGGLVAVTDGRGGILAAWGDRDTLQQADSANLTARFAWSEQGAGTNGMGTALMSEGPIMIRGPEHWCAGFHEWDCAGCGGPRPRHPQPLGALDISSPKAPLPDLRADLAAESPADDRVGVARPGPALAPRPGRGLLGGGAGPSAARWPPPTPEAGSCWPTPTPGEYFGIVRPDRPATSPPTCPSCTPRCAKAVDRPHGDGHWTGVANLLLPGCGGPVPIAFRPALKDRAAGGHPARALPGTRPTARCSTPVRTCWRRPTPGRLVGLQGDRMVLVSAEEIRYAEADGSYVWLDTDRGRLRVPERGMAALEQRLAGHGFLRVHRHYLVNPRRVKEMAPGPQRLDLARARRSGRAARPRCPPAGRRGPPVPCPALTTTSDGRTVHRVGHGHPALRDGPHQRDVPGRGAGRRLRRAAGEHGGLPRSRRP